MKVFVLDPAQLNSRVTGIQRAGFVEIVDCARRDRFANHALTDSPEDADLVLAPIAAGAFGLFFRDLKTSTLYRTHKHKLYVYCPDDNAYPSLPGVYPAAAQEWAQQKWAVGGHYVSAHIHKHAFEVADRPAARDLLFSFVGSSRTHPVRERIVGLQHPAGFVFDSNSKQDGSIWYQGDDVVVRGMFQRFKEIASRTKFALCPRGVSPSSIRLFEAMEAGCVPVIVADRLVLPQGPDWSAFSVGVRERDVAGIPALLEELEPKFGEMSKAARRAWEAYFSPQATFNSLVEWIAALRKGLPPQHRRFVELKVAAGEYVRPANIRTRLRRLLRRG